MFGFFKLIIVFIVGLIILGNYSIYSWTNNFRS